MLRLALLAILVQTVVGGGGQSGGGGHHKPPGGGGGDGHHGGGGGNDGRPSKPTAGPPVALPTPQPSSAFRRRLVVFGDSLSDDGTGAWTISDNTLPISPPYHNHGFSDGPIWAQLLADERSYDLHTYAIGGATSDNSLVQGFLNSTTPIAVPSVSEQISAHLAVNEPRKTDVYTIWIGGNDALLSSGAGRGVSADQVVRVIDKQVAQLYVKGVRKIVLGSLPDLASLPIASGSSRRTKDYLAHFSRELRAGLMGVSLRWKSRVNIQVADVYAANKDLLSNPKAYGFDLPHAKIPCYSGSYHTLDAEICNDPSERIYYDRIHPSHAAQRIIAQVFKTAMEKL